VTDLDDLFDRLKKAMQDLDELFQEASDELARSRGHLFRVETWDKDTGEHHVEYMSQGEFARYYRENYEKQETWGERNPSTEKYMLAVIRRQADAVESKQVKMQATYLGGKR
jgi:hypothetical protein